MRTALSRALGPRGALACVLGLALALTGCSGGEGAGDLTTQALVPDQAAAVSQQVPAGKARLVLSRPSGVLYAAVAAAVKVNGDKVADLYGGNTQSIDIPAGKASITVDAWSYPGSWTEELSAAAGTIYRIDVAPRQDGVGTAVLFGAIGGAIEAHNNPKSGLFEWKVTGQTQAQVAAVAPPAPPSKQAKAKAPAKPQPAARPAPTKAE